MPANKMPEAVAWLRPVDRNKSDICGERVEALTSAPFGLDEWTATYTADQMRAMYLAGIEAARACVPGAAEQVIGPMFCAGFNECRKATLTNLTALEQEAKP